MPQAKERLWIATADIKDMYVDTGGHDMVPFLKVLAGMVKNGVEVLVPVIDEVIQKVDREQKILYMYGCDDFWNNNQSTGRNIKFLM